MTQKGLVESFECRPVGSNVGIDLSGPTTKILVLGNSRACFRQSCSNFVRAKVQNGEHCSVGVFVCLAFVLRRTPLGVLLAVSLR
jgi:hypothetical protein